MTLGLLQYLTGAACGALVGFSLGLIGGGGSILAVPLLVYAVGVGDAHRAVGTSALAVAASALINLWHHHGSSAVRWSAALPFALAGIAGAWFGSLGGKAVPGATLLLSFAALMIAVGAWMLRGTAPRIPPAGGGARPAQAAAPGASDAAAPARPAGLAPLLGGGAVTGLLCGFFGIGGGFLIVPALTRFARLPILEAMASSLVAVTAFGLTTAISYTRAGWVDWPLALVLVGGAAVGGYGGTRLARRLALRPGALNRAFAAVVFTVAAYMLWRGLAGSGR
ncbi:MAG: sulfite exporter TauE/SafE family protein [Proteobacteria bacterium]|nr:sulfite exporter TauE/SafE family protein [Pseudomonadota bacterium]